MIPRTTMPAYLHKKKISLDWFKFLKDDDVMVSMMNHKVIKLYNQIKKFDEIIF